MTSAGMVPILYQSVSFRDCDIIEPFNWRIGLQIFYLADVVSKTFVNQE